MPMDSMHGGSGIQPLLNKGRLITHRSRGGDWVTTAVAEVLQPCCSIRSRGRISMRSQTDVGGMSAVARLISRLLQCATSVAATVL